MKTNTRTRKRSENKTIQYRSFNLNTNPPNPTQPNPTRTDRLPPSPPPSLPLNPFPLFNFSTQEDVQNIVLERGDSLRLSGNRHSDQSPASTAPTGAGEKRKVSLHTAPSGDGVEMAQVQVGEENGSTMNPVVRGASDHGSSGKGPTRPVMGESTPSVRM